MQSGKIYLIPTPLAFETNEKVLPPYILEVIKSLKIFFVENIRTSRRFISSLKLNIDINSLIFYELNKDTPVAETQARLKIVLEGNEVGLMSEAGCPAIADPGAVLVELAQQADIQVVPLVGPSSILLALMASGMNGQSFAFQGYLPIKSGERRTKILQLEKDSFRNKQTQIFIETPYRNNQLLADLLACLNPETRLCLAIDLTSETEYIKTQKVKKWQKQMPDINKKPAIFLLQAYF